MSKVVGLSSLSGVNRFAGQGRAGNPTDAAPRDIVEEMAAALAKVAPPPPAERPPNASGYAPLPANIAASLPINDFEDDFPDDGPVALPSAWLKPQLADKRGWLGEQARSAGFGLAIGLAVVVPLALILSGFLGGVGQVDLVNALQPQKAPPAKAVLAATKPTDEIAVVPLRPRIVVTTPVVVAPSTPEPTVQPVEARVIESKPMEAALAAAPAMPPVRDERAELAGRAADRIAAGDIIGARDILARIAATGDSLAVLSLGETFDPNMLAAWGVKGVAPDVGAARSLYRRALAAGITRAQTRLEALE